MTKCDLDILLFPPSAEAAAAARAAAWKQTGTANVIEREIYIIFCQASLVTVDLEENISAMFSAPQYDSVQPIRPE